MRQDFTDHKQNFDAYHVFFVAAQVATPQPLQIFSSVPGHSHQIRVLATEPIKPPRACALTASGLSVHQHPEIGRRAWLFSATPEGAMASANMFLLIQTANSNGIEPYAYMQKMIGNIANADTDEAIDALIPWKMN